MPQQNTRRSSIDSLLPQFAPPTEQPISSGMTPNGDHGHVDTSDHLNGANGHAAALESDNGLLQSDDLLAHRQNGTGGHLMLETTISQTPSILAAAASDYLNGAAVLESTLHSEADETETPVVADRHASLEMNEAAEVQIGDSCLPTAPAAEPLPQIDETSRPEQAESQLEAPASSPHPAAGSLFTPYLVTEIRELRNRRTRRSWWRRIFG